MIRQEENLIYEVEKLLDSIQLKNSDEFEAIQKRLKNEAEVKNAFKKK